MANQYRCMPNQAPPFDYIKLKVTIWSKDSHQLFDYENNDNKQIIFKIKSSGTLLLTQKEMKYTKKQVFEDNLIENVPQNQNIFKIIKNKVDNHFYLRQILDNQQQPTSQSCWIVAQSVQKCKNKGFRLIQGDFFKLGRLKFRIRQICEPGKKVQQQIQQIIEEQTEVVSDLETITEQITMRRNIPMCKICLSEQQEAENPLVNPCKCTGSMKFVHIQCIQYWVRSKLQNNYSNPNCIVLLTKFFECELCKTKYPPKFNSEGRIYDIVEYSKPDDGFPYIVLEVFTGNKMQIFGTYLLKLSGKNTFTIGRSHDADIKVSDISVSRQHAQLFYDNKTNQIFIKDKNSKFGSLVLMRNDLKMCKEVDKVQIQNGRTHIQLIYDKPKSNIISSCMGNNDNYDNLAIISEDENDFQYDTQ
ncbi:hypothetical protein IMG5_139130 [Ichthyophthirius multifiliis]|uniref:FHA domain protein n=1 Tax=Ichthyophthirius multifiliis TaxID=5932 RepID=G0QX83_ICHMU|nr:hypothetical protein IMG5_139130 [Ichthyophthirius multifiliis]EGR30176.1 hypothetical protein IMG5_139130 [Ichthyophthirius multifiliis]|eukprot:XP_004031412.1 hypothetical protein IMG5_139130 [Ichthyophthirius multifiliis]